MKAIERIIHRVARFAVGFGIGLALVCTFVIVTTDIGPDTRRSKPVVHLDPVVVTISAERFAAIASALRGAPPALARAPDRAGAAS